MNRFLTKSFVALLIFSYIIASAATSSSTQDDDGMIHLHIIPHTHNDAGWLYTVDSYFKGDNPRGCVECILNSVTDALQVNPDRRFVYVEQVFFQTWWNEIPTAKRQTVLDLINNGQLDFLLAGYVMNDEACSYYDDIIEQMTLGHRFVKETFNRTVNVGWHIDPFGHSASQARLFSEMGFDSWFFERIDFQDFDNRVKNGDLEMIWRPNTYDPKSIFLLAHVNYMSYYLAPFNWCIDMLCYPQASMPEVVRRALRYVSWVKNQTSFFSTKHILHHVGGDFEWSGNAEMHFEGLETLIDYINAHPELGIKAYFSTPSNYTTSVYNEVRKKNITLAEKTDDFFPYQDVPNGYWSGYFTSKSSQKSKVKESSKFLQSSKKLITKLLLEQKIRFEDADTSILHMERAVSILQHHDAVTGTAKHAVDVNYTAILNNGHGEILDVILPQIKDWYDKKTGNLSGEFAVCQANATSCKTVTDALDQEQPLALVIFNPSQHAQSLIKLPVPSASVAVYDQLGTKIPHDVLCNAQKAQNISVVINNLPNAQTNGGLFVKSDASTDGQCELFFYANASTNTLTPFTVIPESQTSQDDEKVLSLDANHLIDLFEGDELLIEPLSQSYTYKRADGTSHGFNLDYRYYPSYDNKSQQVSGAYIFRSKTAESVSYSSVERMSVKNGALVTEISIERALVTTKLRIYKDLLDGVIEIETFLRPAPISDGVGKEITLNVGSSDIQNNGVFYTDANGLEMQKRVINFRSTYNVDVLEPAAGNYYPINSAIYIQDQESQNRMTLMNDRSQGGSSLKNGSIEIMIHRRILCDDDRGVDEP